MPIKRKVLRKIRTKPKKGSKAKQVIGKGKQNIQIHIDLSKKTSKKTSPARPSPPAIYGMSAPTNSSSSLMDALNLITAQNLKYEQAHKYEVKSENVITGRKENENPISLGEKLNKNFVHPMKESYGFQDEYPQEGDLFSENPELEERYYSQFPKEKSFGTLSSSSSSSSSLSIPNRIGASSTINYSKMKLPELQEAATERGIDIYKEDSNNPIGKGRGYKPTKNKQQLINELLSL